MTEQRAIDILKVNIAVSRTQTEFCEAAHAAISALEEIQKYRETGTIEECREARNLQEPKKPVIHRKTNRADCPVCGNTVRGIDRSFGDWCSRCGHKLDWSCLGCEEPGAAGNRKI